MSADIDMSDVIFADGSEILTVRRSTGAVVDMFAEAAGEKEIQIEANVQPISPSARKLLPEGVRVEDAVSIYTLEPFIHEQNLGNGSRMPDMFERDGAWWQISGEATWLTSGAGFVHSIAIRLDKSRSPDDARF